MVKKHRALYLKDIEAVFSGASSRHSCQYLAKNKSNDYVWLECKGSVIFGKDGRPLVFAGLMTRLDNQNKYDPLTHLFTNYEMQKYDFSTGRDAILLLGINSFRKINNTDGFLYGNKVLIALSEYLEHSLEYTKEQKQGWIAEFSEKISQRHLRTSKLHEALTQSIHNNFEGFELYFQPILDTKTKKIIECESLLRWKTPEIQDATPYEFIKLLENSGEIREVGFWVMEEALRHAAKWQKKYHNISVSFNVSYIQLLDGEFINKLITKAQELQVNPRLIMVELTESCNADDTKMLSRQFSKLQKLGFKIAMDDFGTEYASFGLLHDVSMDVLKIDQKFVRGLVRDICKVIYIQNLFLPMSLNKCL